MTDPVSIGSNVQVEVTTQVADAAGAIADPQAITEAVTTTVVTENIISSSLAGLLPFVQYFALSVVLLLAFAALYLIVTPHKEIALIKEGNKAAALGFAGALLGFSFPLVKAMEQSVSIPDFIIWSGVGCITQLVAFLVSKAIFGNLKERIESDQVSVGVAMAGISIVVGMLNAASMSY